MTGTVSAAISDEEVLAPNPLASVTAHFVVLRDSERQTYTIFPVCRLAAIEMVKKPYPGLLVISGGLFVISAAAFASKEGDGAGIPMVLLGLFLLITYFGTRRATVTFSLDSGAAESVSGSIKDAAALMALLDQVRESHERPVKATTYNSPSRR